VTYTRYIKSKVSKSLSLP